MNCQNCNAEADTLLERQGVYVCIVCVPLYERRQRDEAWMDRIEYLLDRIDDGTTDVLWAIERLPQ